MLDSHATPRRGAGGRPAPVAEDAGFSACEAVAGDASLGLILICDHASNAIPARYGLLGIPRGELERHIAYDIGVDGVTRGLSRALGVPAVLSRYSRLLIDPNRGEDDPTLIMRISDGAIVPGNAAIDAGERAYRIAAFYEPYHAAIRRAIDDALARGIVPALLSIHSFTPVWRGRPRPWHAGILWDRDPRFAAPLIRALETEPGLVIGDNEPYSGEVENDTMYRHASLRGLAHGLIEIRQDLIGDSAGIAGWVERLARVLPPIVAEPALHEVKRYR